MNLKKGIDHKEKRELFRPSCLEKAIELKPEGPSFYDKLGNTFTDLQEYETALEYYKNAVEIYPKGDNYWSNLAVYYHNMSDLENALVAFKKAVSLNPKSHTIFYNLGNLYRDKIQILKVEECYEKVLHLISPLLIKRKVGFSVG